MTDFLMCKTCGTRFMSPMQGPPGAVQGPRGAMMTGCPKCGKTVDVLYDKSLF